MREMNMKKLLLILFVLIASTSMAFDKVHWWQIFDPPTSASYTFSLLNDVPTIVGKANKVFSVNGDEDGFAWITAGSTAEEQVVLSGTSVAADTDLLLTLESGLESRITIATNSSMIFRADVTFSADSAQYAGCWISGVLKRDDDAPSFVEDTVKLFWNNTGETFDIIASYTQLGVLQLIASGPAGLDVSAVVTTSQITGVQTSPVLGSIKGGSVATTSGIILSMQPETLIRVNQTTKVMRFNCELSAKFDGGNAGAKVEGTIQNNAGTISFTEPPIYTIWSNDATFDVIASYTNDGRLRLIASGPAGLEINGFFVTTNTDSTSEIAVGSTQGDVYTFTAASTTIKLPIDGETTATTCSDGESIQYEFWVKAKASATSTHANYMIRGSARMDSGTLALIGSPRIEYDTVNATLFGVDVTVVDNILYVIASGTSGSIWEVVKSEVK
jgi:hypothetical protein